MARQFVIVNSCFGYDMFIMDARGNVSDIEGEALLFTYGEDNPTIKVLAYATMTGLDGWEARVV